MEGLWRMKSLIELRDAWARLVIDPSGGAAITRYDALPSDGAPVPLFKPAEGERAFGCQLLVPWSNRISGGGFDFEGRSHRVEPNVPGEPYPLHGDGFQKPWRVAKQGDTSAELGLDAGAIGPYRYAARVTYALQDGTLAATLSVENRADFPLPYGLGFHPWFPRHRGTRLTAKAERVWLEDERHLPTGVAPVEDHPAWNFARSKPLPGGWVNNGFDGWNRRARIVQQQDGIVLRLNASPELGVFILYSPSPDAGFFCFEPVSHVVDAHHGAGLTRVAPGKTMRAEMRLGWRAVE
jgi:aldose 1-epimerase